MSGPSSRTPVPRVFRARPLVGPTDSERLAAARHVRASHLSGFFFDAAAGERAGHTIRVLLDGDDTLADRALILAAADAFGTREAWPASIERTAAWYEARPDVADYADAYASPRAG